MSENCTYQKTMFPHGASWVAGCHPTKGFKRRWDARNFNGWCPFCYQIIKWIGLSGK